MAERKLPTLEWESDTGIVTDTDGRQKRFARYNYQPPSSGRTVRLLKIHGTVELHQKSVLFRVHELVEHELDGESVESLDVSKSPYVAMSYCWGSEIADEPLVIIDEGREKVLPITVGAREAIDRTLPALGWVGKGMWIDQVCINQEDKSERAEQVKLMGDIYRQCYHCMIWLGSADADTPNAYSLLRRLHQSIDQYQSLPIADRHVADLSHAQIRAKLALGRGSDDLPSDTDPGWVAVAKLLQRPWFTRVWTFQEAVLCYTGDASFRCGDHNIAFKTFTRASMFLGDQWTPGGIDFTGANFSEARSTLSAIAAFRDHVGRDDPRPLSWLLQNNLNRNCIDPRDRIYAFLGLRHEDAPFFSVDVDYQRPPRELYIEVARNVVRSQENLRICIEGPERVPGEGIAILPSWVPDWTKQPIATGFEKFNVHDPYFKASQDLRHIDEQQNAEILRTEGKVVDRMVEFIDVEVPNDSSQQQRSNVIIQQLLPVLITTMRSYTTSMSDVQIVEKIIRTITLDGYTRQMNQGDSGLPLEAWSEAVYNLVMHCLGDKVGSALLLGIDPAEWLLALTRQALQCVNRRFVLLKNNVLGLVPKFSRPGDYIVILHGSSLPLVIRSGRKGCFELVGACFVDGIMFGERVDWKQGDKFDLC